MPANRRPETSSKRCSRRQFLRRAVAASGGAVVLSTGCSSSTNPHDAGAADIRHEDTRSDTGDASQGPLIFLAIDSLHPAYLQLDREGNLGGSSGNWLMPNVRSFLDHAVWYPKARCFLPSATDMNHMNALAGGNSSQTGILGISVQMMGWDSSGQPVFKPPHLSWLRDDQGRSVDTLFHAWKRARPTSKTAIISGKHWVGDMFRTTPPLVDVIVTGAAPAAGASKPTLQDFADPPTDSDAKCDPESSVQVGLLSMAMGTKPEIFPPDAWVVDATLSVFAQTKPDLAYVLLAQMDDAGHALGAAWNPAELVKKADPYLPPEGCPSSPGYQLVSTRDCEIYREPILDAVRDVDVQFGRLLGGLKKR